MIKKITLKNYRCFENYSVNFKKECLIADENNAGKSTIIESLRIVSIVSRKLLVSKYYVNAPESMKLAKNFFGLNINVDQYKIDLRTIVYFYDENKNAEIICEFEDNVIYHIYLNTEKVFACIYYKSELIKGIKKAKDIKPSSIEVNIMPHLSLIRENERKISSDTINNDQYTYLSSKHFRNEILLNKKNSFDIFKSVAEELWNGLNIREIYDTGSDEDNICLLIQDNNFASEIGLMGSGLQMYLQIVWFISRHSSDSTVILDEPDVYLHPSLQKKNIQLHKIKI